MAKATCSIEGCEKVVQGRGLCNVHYRRWWRPNWTPRSTPFTDEQRSRYRQRFEAKINYDGPTMRAELTPCWVWTGKPNASGYGQFAMGGHGYRAHVAAWVLADGPIPPETPCVCHACDNPICVRMSHLFLGTRADNNADRKRKGRGRNIHCKWGHPFDAENTYVDAQGHRTCRACGRRRNRAHRRERKIDRVTGRGGTTPEPRMGRPA